jgi:hypothetical protein
MFNKFFSLKITAPYFFRLHYMQKNIIIIVLTIHYLGNVLLFFPRRVNRMTLTFNNNHLTLFWVIRIKNISYAMMSNHECQIKFTQKKPNYYFLLFSFHCSVLKKIKEKTSWLNFL